MKIVHLADLHLGYRTYNKLSPEGLNVREKDIIKAFNEALENIAEINPDLILMAGDIFHKPRPSNSSILLTIKLLQKFRQKCQSPIIMIAGNHEAAKSLESGSVLKIFETVIPKVKVIDTNIEAITLDNINASVLCIPHGAMATLEKVDLRPDKHYKHNILMVHGTYENCPELAGYGNGSLIKKTDIAQAEWDYIAFGHYHTFTELAPNTYYSGAIERTTTNIWQEANDKKGFIEFDLDKKECKFHSLSSPRKVVDIKRLNAKDMPIEQINQKIIEEVEKIPDLENCIVRMNIENIDNVALRGLDYKKIREWKKKAVHFRLNIIKKELFKDSDEKNQDVQKKKGVYEYLDEELSEFELSHGLDKDQFRKMALTYLEAELVK